MKFLKLLSITMLTLVVNQSANALIGDALRGVGEATGAAVAGTGRAVGALVGGERYAEPRFRDERVYRGGLYPADAVVEEDIELID